MTRILALDTSSDTCSVSLCLDGEYFSLSELAPRKHAQLLMPMVQQVLSEQNTKLKELDAIAFGCGPGSFTGLRISAGVTQGLAYGSGCQVVPVSNLRALALQAYLARNEEMMLCAVDARMDEVYWSLNKVIVSGNSVTVESVTGEKVSKPESVLQTDQKDFGSVYGVGSGFGFIERFSESVKSIVSDFDAEETVVAESICKLAVVDFEEGVCCAPESAAPVYVRDEVAWKKLPGRE